MSISRICSRLSPRTGFTLVEVVTSLVILAVLAVMLVPLATTLLDSQRANNTEADLNKIYTAIVGDPNQNTYGYLGDVGAFPPSLMDLVQSPGATGWNGPAGTALISAKVSLMGLSLTIHTVLQWSTI